jgi:O-antigen/teichoic acid export membrane protein
MISFLLFLPVRGVALPILMGLDKPRRPALALLVMGLVNVTLSIALVGPYGLLGVALGTAIPNVLFALFVAVTACRELQLGIGRYLGHVLLRPLFGALLPAAGLYAWKVGPGIEGMPWLMVSGISFTLLYALLSVVFVYRGDPHVDLDAQVRRLIGRSKNTGGQA